MCQRNRDPLAPTASAQRKLIQLKTEQGRDADGRQAEDELKRWARDEQNGSSAERPLCPLL